MTARETSHFTRAMRDSGRVLAFDLPAMAVDKHSTGGVGDKVSISLASIVAACGGCVPMIAGRGLGHTGGTLDKLEAIPGFRVDLPLDRFRHIVETHGACIIGQTAELCPADRRFYAVRDVTATVESIPLIVASILSKKSAEGARALVMDVKTGSGAFFADEEKTRALAVALCETGRELGLNVRALMTDMDQILGRTAGNAMETREAIAMLKGEADERYRELTLTLAAHMLEISGVSADLNDARSKAEKAVSSGAALERLARMIEAQQGDPRVCEDDALFARARYTAAFPSPAGGYLAAVDVRRVGRAAMALGAGRERLTDKIDPAVGFAAEKRLGDEVREGEPLLVLHYNDESRRGRAEASLLDAFTISEEPVNPPPLVRAILSGEAA
ncbi:MAG: thymidine phosphorylase [Deltaproteobacteria bacterium]|nr:thymidine phosphorylase [Deltaproteobacteria bacterium]